MKKKTTPPSELERAVTAFLDAESRNPEAQSFEAQSSEAQSSEAQAFEALESGQGPEIELVAVSGKTGQDAGEEALFALFAALPHPGPVAMDFTHAVLRRSDAWHRDLGWAGRLATAAAYFLVLIGAYWTWPVLFQLAANFEIAGVITALVDSFTFLVACLGDLVSFAERVAGYGRVLWLILFSPPVILTLTLSAALTLLMGRWLAALLTVPRSSFHAAAP